MTITNGVDGFLVPVNDVEEMAAKMTVLADDEALAQNISNNGTKVREKLSVNAISSLWLDYINKVRTGKKR